MRLYSLLNRPTKLVISALVVLTLASCASTDNKSDSEQLAANGEGADSNINTALIPKVSISQRINANGHALIVDASGSTYPENAVVMYHWSLMDAPRRSRSGIDVKDNVPAQSLIIDQRGTYELALRLEVDGKLSETRTLIFIFPNKDSKTIISNVTSEF